MKLSSMNEWLTLTANLGVIAGIVFLALEIQQNNALMASEARYNRFEASNILPQLLLESSGLDLLEVVGKPIEELSPVEVNAIGLYGNMMFNSVEWTFRELPPSELPIERWRRIINQERYRNVWAIRKTEYEADFIQFMETVIFVN